jgi:hypothetical protein
MDNFGLNMDDHPDDLQVGEWTKARNVISINRRLRNERGTDIVTSSYEGRIIGIIPTDDGYIEFRADDESVSQIVRYIKLTDSYQTIISDTLLDFSTTNPVRGVFHRNFAGQLIIAWWEGCDNSANVPRLLNIDCMPFTLTETYQFVNAEDVELLRLFPIINNCKTDLIKVLDSGGLLTTGVYYVYIAYELGDGSRTSFFGGTNPISIFDEHTKEEFYQIDGATAGTASNKSIKVEFSNIDQRFKSIAVAIVSKIGGVVSAKLVSRIRIISVEQTFIYTGAEFINDLDLSEVIVPIQTYDRIHTGTVHESLLYTMNVRTEGQPAIQKYVNNVKLKWTAVDQLDINSYEGSFKNPNNIFYFRNWRSFAVYAFYLIVHMHSGQKWAYHIPGRVYGAVTPEGGPQTVELDTIENMVDDGTTDTNIIEANRNFGDKRYYQIFDTSNVDGTLGMWYNLDEFYEDTDCNDIVDACGEEEEVIGSLRNLEVRHHRMPSIARLNELLGDSLVASADLPVFYSFDMATSDFDHDGGLSPFGHMDWSLDGDNTAGYGYFDVPGRFVFTKDCTVIIKFNLSFSNIDDQFSLDVGLIRQEGGIAEYDYIHLFQHNIDLNLLENNETYDTGEQSITVNAKVNDRLYCDVAYETGLGGGQAAFEEDESHFEVYLFDPEAYPTSRNIIGIKIEDLCIPAQYRDDIIGYELGYAERTPNNQVVFDQDVIKYNSGGFFKAHPFDSLLNKTSSQTDFINIYYEMSGLHPTVYSTRVISNVLLEVANPRYIPTNVSEPTDNIDKEEHYRANLIDIIVVPPSEEPPNIYYYDALYLVDFLRILDNVYANRYQQAIVRTGFVYDYTEITAGDKVIYGGDNFISLYGVLIAPSPSNDLDEDHDLYRLKNLEAMIYPVESIANIGLRHSLSANYYFPHDYDYDNIIDPDPDVEPTIRQTTNGMLYNSDYSSVNNLELQLVVKCQIDCSDRDITRFPTRIHRSISSNREEYTPGWRTFLVNDYYEMPKDKGYGWVLNSADRYLYIQLRQALFVADASDIVLSGSTQAIIGRGDLFNRAPIEVIPIGGGYIGCGSQWATFISPVGYVVLDASTLNRGRVFIVSGVTPKDISAVKVDNFMRDYLPHYASFDESDNPFIGQGHTACYDHEHKRILISKHNELIPSLNIHFSGFLTFTMSFDVAKERWIGFHDYCPNIYFTNRHGVYSVYNQQIVEIEDEPTTVPIGRVYRLNHGTHGRYHTNIPDNSYDPVPSYVDFIDKMPADLAKLAQQHQTTSTILDIAVWKTVVYGLLDKIKDTDTITHIMIYNDHQCTGLLTLVNRANLVSKANEIRNDEGTWHFDNIRDAVVDRNAEFMTADGYVVGANMNMNKPFFKRAMIIGDYALVRMVYDNLTDYIIEFHNISITRTKSLR